MSQTPFNATVLKLKLKRNKLDHQLDENKKILIIGKSANQKRNLLLGVITPLVFAGILIFLLLTGFFPPVGKTIGTALGFLLFYALISTLRILLNKKRNSGQKIFSSQGVTIIDKKQNRTDIPTSQITGLSAKIEEDPMMSMGIMELHTTTGEKHLLFQIEEKNPRYLRDDLEFIRTSLEQLTGLLPG